MIVLIFFERMPRLLCNREPILILNNPEVRATSALANLKICECPSFLW
jgi:hypothetical protein